MAMPVTDGSVSSWGSASTFTRVVAGLARSSGGRSRVSLSSSLVTATSPGAEVGHGDVRGDVLAIIEEWDSG